VGGAGQVWKLEMRALVHTVSVTKTMSGGKGIRELRGGGSV